MYKLGNEPIRQKNMLKMHKKQMLEILNLYEKHFEADNYVKIY